MTTTSPAAATVLPLAAATDYRIAGRKAATLARLAAAGFPVPPGVVVPTVRLEPPVDSERQVPAEIGTALLSAARAWGDVPLAVRSSGVEEDGSDASYAGLFTSILDVRSDKALLEAVRACWNSAFDSRVTSSACCWHRLPQLRRFSPPTRSSQPRSLAT